MHPAASVILFTTSTGLGYGLLIWLSLNLLMMPNSTYNDLIILSTSISGFILISFGLCSSLFHLGRPKRAWRAMSQWRTSWLSREGILAMISFIPMLLIIAMAWFTTTKNGLSILAILLFALSIMTIYATAMIYACLKPIPAWYNRYTKLGYLLNATVSGGIGWFFINRLLGQIINDEQQMLLLMLIFTALLNKLLWFKNLKKPTTTDAQTAIGIKGKIRLLDPPHSSDNYLMKEMGFVLARQYRKPIRLLTIIGAYMLPLILLTLFSDAFSTGITLILCMVGMLAERYSFFSEAKHVVTFYYRP